MYSFRHTYITHLYRELRKSYTPFETKSNIMLITGHSTMTALEKYLRDIDAELPEDYSHLLETNHKPLISNQRFILISFSFYLYRIVFIRNGIFYPGFYPVPFIIGKNFRADIIISKL